MFAPWFPDVLWLGGFTFPCQRLKVRIDGSDQNKGGSDVCHVSGRISYHITRFLCVWKWSTPPKCTCFYNFLIGKIWQKYGKICENMEHIWDNIICENMESIWEKYGKTWIRGAPHLGGRKQLFEINLREADLFVPSDGDPSGFFGFPWADCRSTVHIKTLIHS